LLTGSELAFNRKPAFHLGPDAGCLSNQCGQMVGVKDQSAGSALQVKRPAIVAPLAAIRHQGIGLLLSLAKGFQILQGLLQFSQIGREAGQLAPRGFGLPADLCCRPSVGGHILFLAAQERFLGLNLV
jgi:hypothetical protein